MLDFKLAGGGAGPGPNEKFRLYFKKLVTLLNLKNPYLVQSFFYGPDN